MERELQMRQTRNNTQMSYDEAMKRWFAGGEWTPAMDETEAFRDALVEIVEGYRFGRYPDSIRAAERILAQYPKR